MIYSYDPVKRAANLKKHDLDFGDARLVIESGSTLTFEDRRFDYGEERYLTMGLLRGEVVVVVSNEADDRCRIISMRRATRYEKELYFSNKH